MLFKKQSIVRLLAATLLLVLLALAPVAAVAEGTTVVDIGYDANQTTWVRAVNSAELTKTFTEHGPFTTFVPTNAAFAALTSDPFVDRTTLRQLVLHHTLQGVYTTAQLGTQTNWTTAFGSQMEIRWANGELLINNQLRIVTANLPASNGMVHIVDAVSPLPGTYNAPLATAHNVVPNNALDLLAKDDNCTMFVSLIEEMGLEHLINEHGTFTIFVPTDDVFAAISAHTMGTWHTDHTTLKQRMLYHIIPGGKYAAETNGTFNTALGKPLTVADGVVNGAARIVGTVEAENGVLHMVTNVLTPPADTAYTPPAVHRVTDNSLLGMMVADDRLNMFVNEVEMSGLENLLTKHGRFTVYAPTDAAYAAMDADLMTACMVDHRLMKQLTLYHIVLGDPLMGLAWYDDLPTALGEPLATGGLTIIDTISAENGTIHIIDTVQIPEMLTR